MAYGIMTYDCNVTINKNSIFSNIAGGAYGVKRTAGVLFVDRPQQGPNTFLFTGNRYSHSGNIDFQNCIQGMQIRSEQSAAPTQIGINNTIMSPVHTGIYLDARFGGGEFSGASTLGSYNGVKNNQIIASLASPGALISNVGISLHDYSPGFSNVEISNNIVDMSFPFPLSNGGSTGITAHGISGISDPGPGGVEVDIFENRVTLSNGSSNGIGFAGHPNGWIRNNSGGDISSGNGVFVTSGNSWSGIIVNLSSKNNLVSCNDVKVFSNVTAGLLSVDNSQNGQYILNKFEGPGNGAHFEYACNNTEYRCNDMTNNTVGLRYDNFAETGDQGTPSVTNGNNWFGVFPGGGADADISVAYGLSEYYVRGLGNETPPSVNPPIGTFWFSFALPTASTNCNLYSCPAPPPMEFALQSRVSSMDSLVAQGLAIPSGAPYEEERIWQHEYDLMNKLKDHPGLVQDNAMMQSYLAGRTGSNTEAFGNIQSELRTNLAPDLNLLNNVRTSMNSIREVEAQIWVLDSLLGIASDPAQVASLTLQLADQDSILNELTDIQESIVGPFETQRVAAIPALLAQLASINPTNICETNLRRMYEIYLLTVASNIEADSSLLAELEAIATQCPLKGGPGVAIAGLLYEGFTGVLPAHGSCEEVGERNEQSFSKSHTLSIYPNPNAGTFIVNIPKTLAESQSFLRILDAQGSLIKSIVLNGEGSVNLDLRDQSEGLYFVSLHGNSDKSEAIPFIIQR